MQSRQRSPTLVGEPPWVATSAQGEGPKRCPEWAGLKVTLMLRVLVRRISTPDEAYHEGDLIPADRFDDDVLAWLIDTGRVDRVDDDEPEQVDCLVEGCDYSGTERGLAMHERRSHSPDDEES